MAGAYPRRRAANPGLIGERRGLAVRSEAGEAVGADAVRGSRREEAAPETGIRRTGPFVTKAETLAPGAARDHPFLVTYDAPSRDERPRVLYRDSRADARPPGPPGQHHPDVADDRLPHRHRTTKARNRLRRNCNPPFSRWSAAGTACPWSVGLRGSSSSARPLAASRRSRRSWPACRGTSRRRSASCFTSRRTAEAACPRSCPERVVFRPHTRPTASTRIRQPRSNTRSGLRSVLCTSGRSCRIGLRTGRAAPDRRRSASRIFPAKRSNRRNLIQTVLLERNDGED